VSEAYKISFSKSALLDIEEATAYYDERDTDLGTRFLIELAARIRLLEHNWAWHQIRYRNVRQAKVKGFPYWVHFVVFDKRKLVRVVFVQHEKRGSR
jgi:hypothetical protein